MSITPRYISNYSATVFDFLRGREGYVRRIYSDDKGIPTMGIGFSLFQVDNAGNYFYRGGSQGNLQNELQGYGIVFTDSDLFVLDSVLTELNNNNLAYVFNQIPKAVAGEKNGEIIPANNDFSFSRTEDQIISLFGATLVEAQNNVRDRLGQSLFDYYADSSEMVALVSLSFNNPSLIGPKLISALKNGDRAEAWFEIRYDSNSDLGHANRRYDESNQFGLYDNGNTALTETDALSAYRMYTRHRNDNIYGYQGIAGYEGQYYPGPLIKDYLSTATSILLSNYATADTGITNIAWDNIYVGENGSTVYYRGTDNDFLTGSANNDLIIGDSGNDVLNGAGGNNLLYGGRGLDVYNVQGDISDYIKDEDGRGVIVNGGDNDNPNILAVAVRHADSSGNYSGNWVSRDGQVTYSWSGNDGDPLTIVTESQTITINNYSEGNLHLHLIDLPADPLNPQARPTYETISNPDGTQTQIKRNGTDQDDLIFTSGTSNTGMVQGTSGAETIRGGLGNDDIYGYGGKDRLYGDAGDDFVLAGRSLTDDDTYLEGGTGRDFLLGQGGNDHLVGGVSTNNNLDDASNFLDGGYGDDWLEAGSQGDILVGDLGSDLLVGGSGNDYLFGAAGFGPVYGYNLENSIVHGDDAYPNNTYTELVTSTGRTDWGITPSVPELLAQINAVTVTDPAHPAVQNLTVTNMIIEVGGKDVVSP